MLIKSNEPLAGYTSLGCGGPAETMIVVEGNRELPEVLQIVGPSQLWVFGYGANSLISDKGLPGTTLILRQGSIERPDELNVIADAGVAWDELVQYSIHHKLWGLELMSGIPGGVGAAVVGNIAAYGQAVKDTLSWIDVIDVKTHQTKRLFPQQLEFEYRSSAFYTPEFKDYVITRACFKLAASQQKQLNYQSALDIAKELNKDITSIDDLRGIIMETRSRAGSLLIQGENRTAGSFFRNPMVTQEQAKIITSFDETGKTAEIIAKMNSEHGGDSLRVSAAHVLLAAGFSRGQTWGAVRLHPDHVLKIENTGTAKAQEVYDVAHEILRTVKEKFGIELHPEVRFIGDFETT